MYPRATHTRYANEGCCSAGCEAVAEGLIARTDRLTFTETDIIIPYEPEQSKHSGLIAEYYTPVRNRCFEMLQNPQYPLGRRIDMLCGLSASLDSALRLADRSALDNAISSDYLEVNTTDFNLCAAKLIANYYGRHSRSLAPYAEAASEYYGTGTGVDASLPDCRYTEEKYREAEERRVPFELAIENLLANEIFLSGFPFNTNSLLDDADALRALYLLLRYITAAVEDSVYAVFRVVDNTDFYTVAPRLLRGAQMFKQI
jgi:hypothetical protein